MPALILTAKDEAEANRQLRERQEIAFWRAKEFSDRHDIVGLTPDHLISPIDFVPYIGAANKFRQGGKLIWAGAKLLPVLRSRKRGIQLVGKGAELIGEVILRKLGQRGLKSYMDHKEPQVLPSKTQSSPVKASSYQQPKKTGGGNLYTPKVAGRCRKGFYYDKRRKQCIRIKRR